MAAKSQVAGSVVDRSLTPANGDIIIADNTRINNRAPTQMFCGTVRFFIIGGPTSGLPSDS